MTRVEAERSIAELVAHGSNDEVRVLGAIAKRIAAGYPTYGPLRLDRDRRDMRVELTQELLDAAVYGAAELLKAAANGGSQ